MTIINNYDGTISSEGVPYMNKRTAEEKRLRTNSYQSNYKKQHRFQIGVNLYDTTDSEYIAYWKTIPNKADWLRQKLAEEMKKAAHD